MRIIQIATPNDAVLGYYGISADWPHAIIQLYIFRMNFNCPKDTNKIRRGAI